MPVQWRIGIFAVAIAAGSILSWAGTSATLPATAPTTQNSGMGEKLLNAMRRHVNDVLEAVAIQKTSTQPAAKNEDLVDMTYTDDHVTVSIAVPATGRKVTIYGQRPIIKAVSVSVKAKDGFTLLMGNIVCGSGVFEESYKGGLADIRKTLGESASKTIDAAYLQILRETDETQLLEALAINRDSLSEKGSADCEAVKRYIRSFLSTERGPTTRIERVNTDSKHVVIDYRETKLLAYVFSDKGKLLAELWLPLNCRDLAIQIADSVQISRGLNE